MQLDDKGDQTNPNPISSQSTPDANGCVFREYTNSNEGSKYTGSMTQKQVGEETVWIKHGQGRIEWNNGAMYEG